MPSKPLKLRLAAWLGELIGQEALRAGGRQARLITLRAPAQQRRLARLLERACGRAPTQEELEAATREAAEVSGDMLAAFTVASARTRDSLLADFDLTALPIIKQAREQGRGVILASLHYGNWVLGPVAVAAAGVPVTMVVIDGPGYRWMDELGVQMVSVGQSGLDVVRRLDTNGAVWLFCDVDYFPDGRLVPFLGAPIRPPHGVARLAEKTGAPVIPALCVREAGRWRLEALSMIPAGTAHDVERALLAALEEGVRRRPAHWTFDLDVWDIEATDAANRLRLARVERP